MPRKQVKEVKPGEEIVISNSKQEFTKDLIKSFTIKRSLRDFLWNYPDIFLRVFRLIQPFGAILLFTFLGLILFNIFTSAQLVQALAVTKKNVIVEGTVGNTNSLNPIFVSSNNVDKSIRKLVFQKLISVDKDAKPVPEIASSWLISDDNKEYTFTLRNDIKFSDGVKLTAADVAYTFNTAITLAKQNNVDTIGQAFSDVTITQIDDYNIKFALSEVNSTFWEAASVYIVPKHYYENVPLDQLEFSNKSKFPIGSGPYKLLDNKDNVVTLERSDFFIPRPQTQYYTIRLFSSVDDLLIAYLNNQLDLVSNVSAFSAQDFTPENQFEKLSVVMPLRKKLIFFNTREDDLSKAAMRKSLEALTNKEEFIKEAGIDGQLSKGPISESSWAFNDQIKYNEYNAENAASWLGDLGYTKNADSGLFQDKDGKILSFSLTYLENDINTHIAQTLANLWEKEGVLLQLVPQDFDQLTKETIATRNFQLLLYEIETTIDPDQYNLWHSLKVDYPNLNLAGYKYGRIDVLLERSRKQPDQEKRKTDYLAFQKYLMADDPVIFLYQPNFDVYVSKRLSGPKLNDILSTTDLYNNVFEWQFK